MARASKSRNRQAEDACLKAFSEPTQRWFRGVFDGPTEAQALAWPIIHQHKNTLLLAPTGSGKTLAAFMVAIDRIMFGDVLTTKQQPGGATKSGVKVLYISPLKALGVDVERNLQSPLAGIRAVAERDVHLHHIPSVAVRSGDTPAAGRRRITREPPDILITTPESLYLLLTSKAREILTSIDTVVIDEIHSLVGNKRGSHLFLSLERLEKLRRDSNDRPGNQPSSYRPLQRIGLSATQRPLEEIARLLGGAEGTSDPTSAVRPRPVEIVTADRRKPIDLRIEVPVEDMAKLSEPIYQSGPAAAGPSVPSIWPAIHPRLVELVREHRSTMIFVNSRRLAERLAQAINDLAEEEIALAHHGSIAKDTRATIEDRLKRGTLPAIVATSSLELGIDMGAVDLVIQIEAPPTIASGIQRIGRANHQVGGQSSGVVFPKFRGDLLACSAAAERMQRGEVEETFYPRNPLDVLAQQIVAMVSLEPRHVDDVYATVRGAAPFADLPRSSFEGILDLLSGRYPSHEFSELRPRVNWDRITGEISPRRGTQRLAILNAGTIPDRGLYGVFLADGNEGTSRVGELDEEMVFETQPGEVFLLGASSWRVVEITNDRVLVVPAPGEPGRMPFWRGDGPGRPLEFGTAIGELTRSLLAGSDSKATSRLKKEHALDHRAASNLMSYLRDQAKATSEAPSDKTIVVECFIDEIGDWRVCILSPFGSRVHAPWAMAVANTMSEESTRDVDMMWSDDGIVFRLPEADQPPPLDTFFPSAEDVEEIVVKQLGTTALFAARFRENAARALLLPRRMPGRRTPLWLQRRRSADLLSVASRYPSFPILLETYRECLRDVFDVPGLKQILRRVENREITVRIEQTDSASPFAASLLFNYVGNYLYEGDAPLAERRAASLALDHSQLRELLGDAELRELLDPEAIDQVALELQRLDAPFALKDADGLHGMLLQLGDLTSQEIALRAHGQDQKVGETSEWLKQLEADRRILATRIAGENRFIASEDASRYRDAVGIVLPVGLPAAFLEEFERPLDDLVSRFAGTHIPFVTDDVAKRFGIAMTQADEVLKRLVARGRVVEGEFLPGGRGREWCHVDVLKSIKRRSLAKLRKEVEPVPQHELARFVPTWHRLDRPRHGLDGLLDAIEQIQGIPLPVTDLEQFVLPARVRDFQPSHLDELCAAGELTWQGHGSGAASSAKVALYLADHAASLSFPTETADTVDGQPMRQQILDLLGKRSGVFFEEITGHLGAFGNDVLDTLWDLAWAGVVTNDSLAPLRSLQKQSQPQRDRKRRRSARFRSRRATKLAGSEGRWSLFGQRAIPTEITNTQRQMAIATQMVDCYGVLTRELVTSRNLPGGFSSVYPILKAMEETGRVRRGYFVAGLGATQFAAPGADDRLRAKRDDQGRSKVYVMAATDPANAYGSALRWPARVSDAAFRPGRTTGARVIVCDGRLVGYLNRSSQHLLTYLPDEEPLRARHRDDLIEAVVALADATTPVFLKQIDGGPANDHPLATALQSAGFVPNHEGLLLRRIRHG